VTKKSEDSLARENVFLIRKRKKSVQFDMIEAMAMYSRKAECDRKGCSHEEIKRYKEEQLCICQSRKTL